MKCWMTAILALSASFVATVALAADYELFDSTSKLNYYAVERFDKRNNRTYHCAAYLDTETGKPTAQCTDTTSVTSRRPAVEGPHLQSTFINVFNHVPQGFWQIDRTTGKTEFCTFRSPQCIAVIEK
jgi:hypothetical protein